MISRICACTVTSSAVVGSSAISRSGPEMVAMAIITRWRMPPDSSCGYCLIRRALRECAHVQDLERAPLRLAARTRCWCMRSASMICSPTVMMRRQRGQRVLEDHGDPRAAHSVQLRARGRPENFLAAIFHAAAWRGRWRPEVPWPPGTAGSCPSRIRPPRPGIRLRRSSRLAVLHGMHFAVGVAKRTSRSRISKIGDGMVSGPSDRGRRAGRRR